MGKFRQFLIVICPATHLYLQFPTIRNRYQWICTKLGMCIDIVEVWFGIANGQISSIFNSVICLPYMSVFSFLDNNLRKYQSIFTKLGMCIDIIEIWFVIVNGKISSIFDRVICPSIMFSLSSVPPSIHLSIRQCLGSTLS